jgi:hypothetical protein
VTPLSDALTAAQRSALAALEKGYVAGAIQAGRFTDELESCGISDPVDVAFLLCSLRVLREWGVSAPTMSERVAAENEPASEKQLTYIEKLCEDKHIDVSARPNRPLTKAEASEIITILTSEPRAYDPAKWTVPF